MISSSSVHAVIEIGRERAGADDQRGAASLRKGLARLAKTPLPS